jgi:glycopeptide antibiotics resistance protein
MFLRHPFLSLATLGYLGVVGMITLGPKPYGDRTEGLVWKLLELFERHSSTRWIDYNTLEFGMNVLMFVPIGLFFLLLFGRRLWWLSVLFGVALTLGIEFAQMYMPTRVSDVRDILANSGGAFAGVIVGLVLTYAKARRIRVAKSLRNRRTGGVRVS